MNPNQKSWSKKQKSSQSQPADRPVQKGKQQNKGRLRGKGKPQGKERQGFRERDRQKEQRDEPLFKRENLPELSCVICEKSIRNVHAAMSFQGNVIHFDCAIEKIQREEPLKPDERICYLGAGAFGIVTFRQGNQGKFTVKKRIQFEEKDQKAEWRKAIGKIVSDKIAST